MFLYLNINMFEKRQIFKYFTKKLIHISKISINRTLDSHKVLQIKAPLMSMFSRSKIRKGLQTYRLLPNNGGFCNNCMHTKTVLAHFSAFQTNALKNTLFTQWLHKMSGIFWKLYHSVLPGKKN